MKKFLIIALAAFSLVACAQLSDLKHNVDATLSLNNLDAIEASYGAALSVAVGYRRLCQQKAINKSCWKVIAMLQPYQAKAQAAVVTLRNYIKNNPTSDYSSLAQLAKDSIDIFRTQQQQSGVN